MKLTAKPTCPVETTLSVIGGRWKVLILKQLFTGVQRFGELHRALTGISHKTLTQQLRELEDDGIVQRQVFPQIPPRVDYSLTELGTSLAPILEVMHHWGELHADRFAHKTPLAKQQEHRNQLDPKDQGT